MKKSVDFARTKKNAKKCVECINSLFSFYKINSCGTDIPGYFVVSTAPTNLEDCNEEISEYDKSEILHPIPLDGLEEIANDIQRKNREIGTSKEVELVIAIHGYNTTGYGVKKWYKNILDFANKETLSKNFVFLGYRWPSESFIHNLRGNLRNAFSAIPLVLLLVFYAGCFGIGLSFLVQPLLTLPILSLLTPKLSFLAYAALPLLFLSTILFSIPLTLIIIRLLVYLRDSYRATNFGIPDLVELIRQIDDKLLAKAVEHFSNNPNNFPTIEALGDTLRELEKHFKLEIDKNTHEDVITEILKDYLKSENYWTGGEICIPKVLLALGVDGKTSREAEIPKEINQKLKKEISEGIQKGFKDVAEKKDEFGWIENDDKRIRLTFICHSMGAFVTTGAVRILADVFDPSSVNMLDQSIPGKLPTSKIGHVFRLGRLILVSPDIPQLAITSTRSNFLRASLRRFEEAYLFSNEGDMALLVASTSGNYSSLPTRTGQRSFRLGNLTVKRKDNSGKRTYNYGIVNLKRIGVDSEPEDLLNYLEIGGNSLKTIRDETPSNPKREELITNLFTYFDFTDYTDLKYDINSKNGEEELTKESIRILSYPLNHRFKLCTFVTQVRLTIDGLILNSINVHGGYFDGEFSRKLVYQLAFGGFNNLLNSLVVERRLETEEDLGSLSEILKSKKIRVVLSLERYLVDVKMWERNRAREKVLDSTRWNKGRDCQGVSCRRSSQG